jgi:putative colanic acid biosynthesis acetyltransferase WcaF
MINLSLYSSCGFQRGAPAWKEACWWLVRSLLFAHSFPVPSPVKTAALRLFGAKVGRGVVIRSRVNITFPWRFCCGDHVWIGDEVMILSLNQVTLGSSVCISQRAFLCTGSHDFEKESFDLQTAPIIIEDGVWIGAASFVGPGVQFAVASRCLAGAVVVKGVENGQTVGGVPARALKHRGDHEPPSDP